MLFRRNLVYKGLNLIVNRPRLHVTNANIELMWKRDAHVHYTTEQMFLKSSTTKLSYVYAEMYYNSKAGHADHKLTMLYQLH
jgi:hypothetical protein